MEKAIMLLHGFLSNETDFNDLLPYLKNYYSHIEIPIYPGHNEDESYHDFDGEKTIEFVENKLRELTEKYQEVDLVGFSMGGALAAYLAQRFPINKLVLLAPANKYFNFYLPFSKIRYLVKNFYAMEKAFFKRHKEHFSIYKNKLKMMFDDDVKALKIARDKYLKRYLRKVYQNFKYLIKTVNEEIDLITNPCFIAWGKLDQLVPKESVLSLYRLCQHENRKLLIYEDVSHLMLLSANNQHLIKDIVEFLQS
ncbi:MAG: alpha/beta fold hydrolase [Bacilli bacterium]|nr:alpha/beta fold hydrolase [Bacilli bacterium]MDD4077054.1 alpha/beta fold hydrolase [Bacilli bacterium]MDD4387853.1 alpha/beta fold hydrolase [Bacilli bacterium]